MKKAHRKIGPGTRSLRARSLPAVVATALLGLAPLAASSPAASDTGATGIEASASSLVIEFLPLPPTTDVTAPAPTAADAPTSAPRESIIGRGSASYYAAKFHGRRTASGEPFDNADMTAAHRTLPFGSMVRVTNPATGASVVVRINDRGPFTRGRMIDVSRAAAQQLGLVARGHATVELVLVDG